MSPPPQRLPAATHLSFAQQPSPLQKLFSQQTWPGPPQGWNVPLMQIVPAVGPGTPGTTQMSFDESKHEPSRHALFGAQGGKPAAPQYEQSLTPAQTLWFELHDAPTATHMFVWVLQQPSAHSLSQQGWPTWPVEPHDLQRPPVQLSPGAVQLLNGEQQGWSGPPQAPQAPFVQAPAP
jgi:hypothetical protein